MHQSNRILLIDDSKDIHEDFKKVLQPMDMSLHYLKNAVFGESESAIKTPDYLIDSAYQGVEGFNCIEKAIHENKPYFAVFVDIRMPPGWDGIETIEKIWQIDADIQTVICTAYNDYEWQEMMQRLGVSDRLLILKKPFDSIEVRQIACALNEKWNLLQRNRSHLDLLETMVDQRTAEIRGTLEATADGILVVSQLSKIVDYNHNFLNIWRGIKWKEQTIEEILSRRDPSELISFISTSLHNADALDGALNNLIYNFDVNFNDLRLELRLKNGKYIELYTRPLQSKEGILGKVLSFRDTTESKYFEEQLTFQATHDLLTQLPNRTLLVDRIEQAILQAKRSNLNIAIIFLDLDRFKIVNDTLGHKFGDELIKSMADRLRTCKRESDTLCRIGGDEFVLLMPEIKNESNSLVTINKIQKILNEPFLINGHTISLTCSIGICFYPKNGNNSEELIKNADAAMYRAKALGKNNFQFYTEEMNLQMRERFELEQNLYLAYELGELLLHYQPIIDAKTQEIKGSEALLRWLHPQIGMISPLKFISVAEETGLIIPIGEWVLRTACEQNLYWQQLGLKPIPIYINLSGHQLRDAGTIKMISKVISELNYEGRYLVLELTESMIMTGSEAVKNAIQDLQKQGITFAIDDFGTGYSNLNYLMRYPISKLKIDKSFIDCIQKEPSEKKVIQAIISMAHSLNMKVVAEGVETEQQYHFLIENQCDEVQGFYFSKPLDTQSYTLLLQEKISK